MYMVVEVGGLGRVTPGKSDSFIEAIFFSELTMLELIWDFILLYLPAVYLQFNMSVAPFTTCEILSASEIT